MGKIFSIIENVIKTDHLYNEELEMADFSYASRWQQ